VAGNFERLVAEAAAAPADTWDFTWLEGRATEARPSWRYFDLVAAAAPTTRRLLDVDAGTGNLLADLPVLPPTAVAVDGHPPSLRTAGPRLRGRGVPVVGGAGGALPFPAASFDLVVSRHPVATSWTEVARVLEPGGRFLSQQVGPGSLRELAEALVGPTGASAASARDPERARRVATDAGLVVEDLRAERTPVTFLDIGAVVYLLRVVVWTVPDFSVERYESQLRALHERIERDGALEATSSRFLIQARRPR